MEAYMTYFLYAIYPDNDPETHMYKLCTTKEEADKYVKNGFVSKEFCVTEEEYLRYTQK
jgi:hypothetical protein